MKKNIKDKKYLEIVDEVLKNEEFQKLKEYKHHGIDRLTHSINVSYHSYKISKFLRLNYKTTARAGLLHDFFFVNNQKIKLKERIKVLFKHPVYALENSKKNFELTKEEENIIVSHMFPIGLRVPRYTESIIVNMVDNFLSIYERIYSIFHRKTI